MEFSHFQGYNNLLWRKTAIMIFTKFSTEDKHKEVWQLILKLIGLVSS